MPSSSVISRNAVKVLPPRRLVRGKRYAVQPAAPALLAGRYAMDELPAVEAALDPPARRAMCRICGRVGLEPVLSLGSTPLANSLLSSEQLDRPEETFPLELVFCPECTLLQITETVPPEKLFRHYVYFSSFSNAWLDHCRQLVQDTIERFSLNAKSQVMEIASNDGYLLQFYRRAGIPSLGIEPAENIARVARRRGIKTVCDFFGRQLGEHLACQGQRADVLHSHNVLAHVADLHGVVAGAAAVLKPGGVWIIEAPYVRELIGKLEFDTIYHEHLCYFSLTAMDRLFRGHGLHVIDVRVVPTHGGSLRVYVAKQTARRHGLARNRAVGRMLEAERQWGVHRLETYRSFGQKVQDLRRCLVTLLGDLKAAGKRIAVYGASAKGSTLLNYFALGRDVLDFVADVSTAKQGLHTPGSHLKIVPAEAILKRMPDYVLLLTWNFEQEILAQQAEYRRRGGKFIVPIPRVQVV